MKKMILSLALVAAMTGPMAQAGQTKDLVVYYSFTGNTELAAKALAESLKADVLQLEDVVKPSSKEEASSLGREVASQGKSWPVKPFNTDLSGYSRIFVGSPVWFGMPAPAFNAFVEQVDLSGKEIVVFVTMNSGGEWHAIQAMKDKITAKGGKIVSSFSIKTRDTTPDDIVTKARKIAKKFQSPTPAKGTN